MTHGHLSTRTLTPTPCVSSARFGPPGGTRSWYSHSGDLGGVVRGTCGLRRGCPMHVLGNYLSPALWSKPWLAGTPAHGTPAHPSPGSPGHCSISSREAVGTSSDHSCSSGSCGLGSKSGDKPGGGEGNTDMAGDVPMPGSRGRSPEKLKVHAGGPGGSACQLRSRGHRPCFGQLSF